MTDFFTRNDDPPPPSGCAGYPGCVADPPPRRIWAGEKWNLRKYPVLRWTYRPEGAPGGMANFSLTRSICERNFDKWERASAGRLRFDYTGAVSEANLIIGWYRRDGKHGILAEAEIPNFDRTRQARRWFDIAEDWTVIDFETVDLHEGGHNLGIRHLTEERAVMFWQYQAANRNLHRADIDSLRTKYG